MHDSIVDDSVLVAEAIAGNGDAFKKLVERHEGAVASTVVGMLGQTEEAKDVGLEVFVRFHRSMHRFRGDANLRTYLTRIAINLSLNELKRRKRSSQRFEPLAEVEHQSAGPTPSMVLEQSERDRMVRDAIASLDPTFRSVVVLRMVDGRSVKETAAILDVPEGTVLSRLARAQQKLRSIIKPLLTNHDE